MQPDTGLTLTEYAEAKKLPLSFLEGLGMTDRKAGGKPSVVIPYMDGDGQETAKRSRLSLNGDIRFRWRTGDKAGLYGLWLLTGTEAEITLVEGESDAQTLWSQGVSALGIPGASNWREDHAQHLAHAERIYVVQEPDTGGTRLIESMRDSQLADRVHVVTVPEGDPSALYLDNPEQFRARWQKAIAVARPLSETIAVEAEKHRQEAWGKCSELAASPNILKDFTDALQLLGVVGEDRAASLIYLIMTSRLLARPASGAVKGVSSSGKSYTTNLTLEFFPPAAYYLLSGMSERALAYSTEPLKHRVLVLFEAAGMAGDFGSYLLRSLLSEGKVRYETVMKTENGLEARLIEREGPTGLLLTTTEVRLHPENETRMLSIPVNDSRDQTRRVMRSTAEEGRYLSLVPDLEPWVALQEWLATGDNDVVVPFADSLAELIPPVSVRLRRDFPLLLSLIRSHALLHQMSRQRDGEQRIVATLDDYAVVRELVADLISEGVEGSVSDTMRETVEAVHNQRLEAGKVDAGGRVTYAAVATLLDLDKSAGYRRVQSAIKAGYVVNLESQKGRPANLDIADPLPEDQMILPEPDTLVAGLQVHLEGKDADLLSSETGAGL